MRGVTAFIYGLGKIPFETKKELHGDNTLQTAGKQTFGYARGKLAPAYSTLLDFYTKSDFYGNPLPFNNDKPAAGKHKLNWGEYAWQKAPLPAAEAAHVIYQSAIDNGADKTTLNNVLYGIASGALSGGTGFRVGEYNAEEANHSPFTEEDNKKPTFKYFLDKGLELPNAALSSEKLTNEKASTKKFVSDLPKEDQAKYVQEHKDLLEEELSKMQKHKYVYVTSYKDASGNTINEVETNRKNSKSKKTLIDNLSKEELAQVLSIAQSKASTELNKKYSNK